MAKRLYLLVPPSQKKTAGGRRALRKGTFDEVLGDARRSVREALTSYLESATPHELEVTLQARGPLLAQALEAARDVVRERPALMPSWRRYQGVVWRHLEPSSLTPGQRRQILIPSALYGLSSSDDYIADYRLKMNVGLNELGGLARFWKPHLTAVLAQQSKNVMFVDLLPKEHAASIDFASVATSHEVIHVRFIANDESHAIGHDAKAIKGLLARHLVTRGLDDLAELRWRGWNVCRAGSDVLASAPASSR